MRARVERALHRLVEPAVVCATAPVDITAHHLHGEPVGYQTAVQREFTPFAVGDPWGSQWDTTWLHLGAALPTGWDGADTVLVIRLGYDGYTGFGAEGQVWFRGEPVHGVSPNHDAIPVGPLLEANGRLDVYIEAAANPRVDTTADPAPLYEADPTGSPMLTLEACHLARLDRTVQELADDWAVLLDIADHLDPTSTRAVETLTSLNRAATRLRTADDVRRLAGELRAELAPVLAAPAAASALTLHAVGHSHIDTAWLWPFRETVRKCARTFSTALAVMDRFPDYRFAVSQPQQLAWVKQHYPPLFERIRKQVADGRFEPVGGMWVEADCNLPSGESLVRQITHGKRFLAEEFGVDTDVMWLPDVFGYSAALPQLMRLAGMSWFVSQKMSWNQVNRFPHHTFRWRGLDGSTVRAHFLPADTYIGKMTLDQLRHAEDNFAQRSLTDEALFLYGYGDGGGGPTEAMLRRAERLADVEGAPRVRLTGTREALVSMAAAVDDESLPVWSGELYLENHRGTYTTHGDLKRANRRLELSLREAEMWSVAAAELGVDYPAAELDAAWKTLLLHQFHDVLPGSSIHWVHREAQQSLAAVAADVETRCMRALTAVAGITATNPSHPSEAVLVANSLPFARRELVEVGDELRMLAAPGLGWRVSNGDEIVEGDEPPVRVGDHWMSNGILQVSWDDDGLLTSVLHLASGREAIAPGRRGNLLQLHDDHPVANDAWDIDAVAYASATDLADAARVHVSSSGPARGSVVVVRRFGESVLTQEMRLDRGARRLEFKTVVDWHETHKLLKVAFPVDVHAAQATYEIQFGHLQRPTHRNTSWDEARFEVCAHTWADLSESGFGVALLNDCKYGYDVLDNVIRLTLLRSPTFPDPLADRGRHEFTYALMPHPGDLVSGGVLEEAQALNSPLRIVPLPAGGRPGSREQSLVTVDAPAVGVSAVKAADDGDGTIVRIYEAGGGQRTVRVGFEARIAQRVDLLERPLGEPMSIEDGTVLLRLRPFEIVTLRFR